MGRKARVQRTAEEKWQIVLEGLRSGNIAGPAASTKLLRISSNDGKMKWNKARRLRLGGEAQPRALTKSTCAKSGSWSVPWAQRVADRDTKKRAGRVSCGQAHSQARELVAQGKEAMLVADTLAISRSSLYYR